MKRIILFIFLLLFTTPALATQVQISPLWYEDSVQSVQIKIPSTDGLKMALFKRNGYTYFVFQSPDGLQIDEATLQQLPIVHLKHPTALILRGVFQKGMQPEFSARNRTLLLKMRTKNDTEESSFKTKWLLNGALLELNDANLIEFKDPNTMENFFTFLTPYSSLFMKEQYDTPEMTFLPTVQGIVIYPKTSSFHIQRTENGYVIHPQNKKSLTIPESNTNQFEEINWKSYANLSAQDTNKEMQNLKDFILYVSDSAKDRLHQEMVQIYLSQGFVQNALEVLENMPESEIKENLTFLAYIMENNPIQALTLWDNIRNPSSDLELWKNTIDDKPLLNEMAFERINLSPMMAFVFWRNIGQKANGENNLSMLEKATDELEQLSLNDYQKQALIYLQGQLAGKKYELKKAIEIYTAAEQLPFSQYSTQIIFSKINAQIETGNINTDEAILKLEKIRHLLAATELEIPLLQLLANLYNEKKDITQALQTERQMLSLTRDDDVLKRMQRHFEHFVMTSQSPIQRIVIYNEFKELMPTGIKALQIKEQLIRDFITLDLLDKAYDLAFETAQTTFGRRRQKFALYAYLTAITLSDTEKQENAIQYLDADWQKQPIPSDIPEILKWSYRKKS
ncbi:MAG: hypothetical protein J6Y03_05440 [Alphaproteobacteria bacterium]|nr:hypothetical protein [Alphaproteobacteria bacterium]